MSISIQKEGRRYYLLGNTFAHKNQMKEAGCKWDSDRRAWWSSKQDVADTLLAQISAMGACAQKKSPESLEDNDKIQGKARYKGCEYLLLWHGRTAKGNACKLAFSDGSKIFWADANETEIEKIYKEEMTFCKLKMLREEYAKKKKGGEDREESPRATTHYHGNHCRGCRGAIVDAPYHRAMEGYCGRCAFDEFDC